jgi:hypothetical protein
MTRRRTLVVALTAVTALLGAGSPASAAVTSAGPPPGSRYVALGDSFASGPGILPFEDPTCARSRQNYAHQVAALLHLDLVDRSCGGATIDNITTMPQLLPPEPLQIEAVTADTALVTITVGGNDANYVADVIRFSCAHDPAPVDAAHLPPPLHDLVCAPVNRAESESAMSGVETRLVDLVDRVRARAPQARVVLTDFPDLLPQNGKGCAVVPLTTDEARFVLAQSLRLNLAVKHAAQRPGSDYVDISKDSRFHDACAAVPWVNGYRFGDFNVVNLDAYHPRLVAHNAMARRILALVGG